MPIIKEATIKERAMMGSKAVTGNLKRKRDATTSLSDEESNQKYFFSKFLTSPDLLELEASCGMIYAGYMLIFNSDCGHLVPSTISFPTPRFSFAPLAIYHGREGEMVFSSQPLAPNGFHTRTR